jgi:hypothetical protein
MLVETLLKARRAAQSHSKAGVPVVKVPVL